MDIERWKQADVPSEIQVLVDSIQTGRSSKLHPETYELSMNVEILANQNKLSSLTNNQNLF